MNKLIASGILGLSLFASSAYSQVVIGGSDEAGHRLNINIPTDQVTVEQATSLIDFFASSIVEGKTEVVLADELAKVEIPAEYQALVNKVVASRNPSAFVECLGRQCKITSSGSALDFKIDGVTLPVVGTPSVSLSKEIAIYTQVSEDGLSAEICRLEGVAVKVGFIKSAVEGALISVEDGAIKSFFVDAGIGGSYPTNNCNFVSPPKPVEPVEPTTPAQPVENDEETASI